MPMPRASSTKALRLSFPVGALLIPAISEITPSLTRAPPPSPQKNPPCQQCCDHPKGDGLPARPARLCGADGGHGFRRKGEAVPGGVVELPGNPRGAGQEARHAGEEMADFAGALRGALQAADR